MKPNNEGVSKLLLEYILDRTGERVLNWVLSNELEKGEKVKVLLGLDEGRLKQILKNLGFDEGFVKTL